MATDSKNRGSRGTRREPQRDGITKQQMIKALEVASYLIPAGAGINAIRLGYKALKAGKKVKEFAKAKDAAVTASKQAQANAARTVKGNATRRRRGNMTQKQQKASNQKAVNKAKDADRKATSAANATRRAQNVRNRRVSAAGTSAGVAGVASVPLVVGVAAKNKNKNKNTNTNSAPAPAPKPTPKGREGNIGRTSMDDFVPKPKVSKEKTNKPNNKNKKRMNEFGAMTPYMNSKFNRRD
tara:strand:- start:866 stop:1585 length:720 start_codon:yes stop_codon:yes gene_type:complete